MNLLNGTVSPSGASMTIVSNSTGTERVKPLRRGRGSDRDAGVHRLVGVARELLGVGQFLVLRRGEEVRDRIVRHRRRSRDDRAEIEPIDALDPGLAELLERTVERQHLLMAAQDARRDRRASGSTPRARCRLTARNAVAGSRLSQLRESFSAASSSGQGFDRDDRLLDGVANRHVERDADVEEEEADARAAPGVPLARARTGAR